MTKLADVAIAVIKGPWPRTSQPPGNFRFQVFGEDGVTELLRTEQPQPILEIPDDPKFVPGTVIHVRVVRIATDGDETGIVATTQSTVPALQEVDFPQTVSVTWS